MAPKNKTDTGEGRRRPAPIIPSRPARRANDLANDPVSTPRIPQTSEINQVHEQKPRNISASRAPMVEPDASNKNSNNRKHSRDDEDDDEGGDSPASKRSRSDEDEEIDVGEWATAKQHKIRKAIHKIGRPVPPVPSITDDWAWQTENREKAQELANLIMMDKAVQIVHREFEEDVFTRAELDDTMEATYGAFSNKEKEVIVFCTTDDNEHMALPEGGAEDWVDHAEEFAWTAWISRTSYVTKPPYTNVNYWWYWFDGPGIEAQPYNRRCIAKKKEQEIVKWMKNTNQPFSRARILHDTPPTGAGKKPRVPDSWQAFHAWKAVKTVPKEKFTSDDFEKWQPPWLGPKTRTGFNTAMGEYQEQQFETWKRRQTMDQFLTIRTALQEAEKEGDQDAAAIMKTMPSLSYAAPAAVLGRRNRTREATAAEQWWPRPQGQPEEAPELEDAAE